VKLRRGACGSAGRAWQGILGTLVATVGALVWPADVRAGPLQVTVARADGKPLPGAVVLVHGPPGTASQKPISAIVDQVDRQFQPDLVVLPVGSTVSFPNSDRVSHQVYSFSPSKRFQLPLYHGTPYPPVTFDRVGIVTLGCNIHDDMIAYVVVTDAAWFGRTDADGAWRAPDVPAGDYSVEIWHPLMREPGGGAEQKVHLSAVGASVKLKLSKPLRPAPLERKPHSWTDY
jgi:plastocyanin